MGPSLSFEANEALTQNCYVELNNWIEVGILMIIINVFAKKVTYFLINVYKTMADNKNGSEPIVPLGKNSWAF